MKAAMCVKRGTLSAAVVAAAACALLIAGCGNRSEKRPNVLLWVVDTLRADHLEIYGYQRETAPRLAELARDGVVFERTYATSSWTKPSTASLLTGLTPERHRATTRAHLLDGRLRLLPEYLKDLGYHTAAFVTNPWTTPSWGFGRGFDGFSELLGRPRAENVLQAVLRHLDGDIGDPFFLYVHTLDPHGPYTPPPSFRERWAPDPALRFPNPKKIKPDTPPEDLETAVAAYDGEISYGDEAFGRVLDRLREDGLYDDALIIFTSDHGEELGDHGRGEHGRTLFEEVVKVPLVMKLPGNRHAGARVAVPVSIVDLVPSVLAVVGSELEAPLDGIDLLPLLDGEAGATPERSFFLDLDLVYAREERNRARGLIQGPYKYVEVVRPEPARLLFQLATDPEERQNLVDVAPEIADRLSQRLREHESRVLEGFQLRLLNKPVQKEAPHRYTGLLTTRGRFVDLQTWHLEEGDRAALSADGKSLRFDVESRNYPPWGFSQPIWNVDEDTIAFQVDPPDAVVVFHNLETDAAAKAGLYRGAEALPVSKMPFAFSSTDPSLWILDPAVAIERHFHVTFHASPGGYLFSAPPRQTIDLGSLDPEARQRLRALGYLVE